LESEHNIHFGELCVAVGRVAFEFVDDGALRPAAKTKSAKTYGNRVQRERAARAINEYESE
jgi:hypothetical protein